MYTIVGLGNPGSEYARTRHNAGRMLVAALAEKNGIEFKEQKKPALRAGTGDAFGERVRLVLPDTYMNKSGAAVAKYVKSAAAAKTLIVVHDDIDLPFGKVRVSVDSSSGGHNGVRSVERAVKTRNFIRIRIGVAKQGKNKGAVVAKKPITDDAVVSYLLAKFTSREQKTVIGALKERVFLALDEILVHRDPVAGMGAVNGLPAI